jgi:hypothetical protein
MTADVGTCAYRGLDRRSATERAAADYRGPDRRSAATSAFSGTRVLRAAPFVLTFAVVAIGAIRAIVVGGRGLTVTFAALRDTSAGLLLLAGVVLLVLWALTGRAGRAMDGVALLLVGGGLLVLAGPWGALLHQDADTTLVSPACRVALSVPAIVLLLRSPSRAPVDSSIRPIRIFGTAACGSSALLGAQAAIRMSGPLDNAPVWIAAMSVLAVGWIVAGTRRFGCAARRSAPTGQAAMGWSLMLFGLGNVAVAVALETDLRWGVLGVAIQVVGAGGAAAVAVSWLLTVLSHDSNQMLRLAGELAAEQSGRRRVAHDARNVIAAIRTANGTLERHGDRLAPEVQDQLRCVVGSEFDRLLEVLEVGATSAS